MGAIEYVKFEAYGIDVNPSKTNSQLIEVATTVNIYELLNAIGPITIKGYLEYNGFKVENYDS